MKLIKIGSIQYRNKMSHTISTEEKLHERIKELTCLYEVSSILRNHSEDRKNTFEKVSRILKNAWRFPEKAIVELKLDDYFVTTEEIPETSVFQYSEITVFGEKKGYVKIHYPSSPHTPEDFLEEETQLLNKVTEEIASFYEMQIRQEKEEILQRTAQRNDRLSILGEITAGIAHELNTPLGNILGFAELINNSTTDKAVKSDLSKIIKAAIFSREVVKKLMFFACEMPQKMEYIRIAPIISQALSLMKPNFEKAGIESSLEIKDPRLKAQLDPIQLTQIMFNLLINAIYISPRSTTVRVKVFQKGQTLFIEVADQGPGIKKEIKSKIFDPFFTTKPVGEGSGLGLSVVYGIVKSHRGKISTFDNDPTGTVFQIKIPLKN